MPANPRRPVEVRRAPDVRREALVRRPDDAPERLRLAPLFDREVVRRDRVEVFFEALRERVDRYFVELDRRPVDPLFRER
ncbi:MAG TPA: hypothetical protein VFR68_00700 [Candidatus Dormibacteraeota bacterium]|nr:hypothetical protein [Candidatus Dormibacteraeota bacterium]